MASELSRAPALGPSCALSACPRDSSQILSHRQNRETLPGSSFLGDRVSTYLVWRREPLLTGCDHSPRAQDEPLAQWPSLVARRALEARLVLSGQQAVPSSTVRWHRTLWAQSTKPPPWGHRSCFPKGLKVFTPREPRGSW